MRCPPLRASFAQLPFGSLRIVSHNGRPFDVLRFHGRPKQLLCGNPAEVLEHVRSEAALACSPTTYTADSSLALSRHFPLTRASVCRDSQVQRHLARVYATLLVASALAAVGCYAHIAGVLSHGVLTQVHARIGPPMSWEFHPMRHEAQHVEPRRGSWLSLDTAIHPLAHSSPVLAAPTRWQRLAA